LVDVIRIAHEINSDGESPYYVNTIHVFGSYLSDKPMLGDLDLSVQLVSREEGLTRKAWCEWASIVGEEAGGEHWRGFITRTREITMRRLKKRRSHLAFHHIEELDRLGIKRRLVFTAESVCAPAHPALPEDAA